MRSLAALTLLGLTWLALQGALGYQLGREHAGREAERHRADSLQAQRDSLYGEIRVYVSAASVYAEQTVRAEGELSQCRAYSW